MHPSKKGYSKVKITAESQRYLESVREKIVYVSIRWFQSMQINY